MERFARKCDITGKGMNNGYCFNDGEAYASTEEAGKQYVESQGLNWEEELETIDTDDEWFYWTEWEEIDEDENYFDADGNEYTPEGELVTEDEE